jgi:hypothetical protein
MPIRTDWKMLERPLWVLVAGQIMARNPLSLRGVMDAVYLMAKKEVS